MPHDTGGRESIRDVSARLFSQKGYRGVSIRDIAQACGMTNAALYYHFKNKEDLYLAVLRHTKQQVMASLADVVSPAGDLRARLQHLVNRYAEVMVEQRQSFQSLRRDMAHIDDARANKLFCEMRDDFMRPIHQVIEAGQAEGQIAPGDVRLLARLLHGMILALVFEGRRGRQTRIRPEDAGIVVNVFLEGVGK